MHPGIFHASLQILGKFLGKALKGRLIQMLLVAENDEDFPKLLFPFQNEHPISRFVKAAGVSFRPILTL